MNIYRLIFAFHYSFTTAKPAAAAASKPAATPAAPKKAVVLDLSVLCAKTAAKPAAASAQKEAPKLEVKPVEEKKIEQPQPQKPKEYLFFFLSSFCLVVYLFVYACVSYWCYLNQLLNSNTYLLPVHPYF